jgi:hypothetical protein
VLGELGYGVRLAFTALDSPEIALRPRGTRVELISSFMAFYGAPLGRAMQYRLPGSATVLGHQVTDRLASPMHSPGSGNRHPYLTRSAKMPLL